MSSNLESRYEEALEKALIASRKRVRSPSIVSLDSEDMADHNEEEINSSRPLSYFSSPSLPAQPSCISYAPVTNDFEIKSGTIHLLPSFHGLDGEDPIHHLKEFRGVSETAKHRGIDENQYRLRLFPFSLKDKAKKWLFLLPSASISTWDDLSDKFLKKFFPAAKTNEIRKEILGFVQRADEPFHETWERFNEFLNICPHHNFEPWYLMSCFYQGLLERDQSMVDAACGGSFMAKTNEEAKELFESLALNSQQWNFNRTRGTSKRGVYGVAAVPNAIEKEIAEIKTMVKHLALAQEKASENDQECNMEQVNQVGNFKRELNDPYSNSYNPG